MPWTPPERNLDGVQHEHIRKMAWHQKWCAIDDELSDAYYNRKPFRTFGLLSNAQFEKLQAVMSHLYNYAFHLANKTLAVAAQVPEDEYRYLLDAQGQAILDKFEDAETKLAGLKTEGFEISWP